MTTRFRKAPTLAAIAILAGVAMTFAEDSHAPTTSPSTHPFREGQRLRRAQSLNANEALPTEEEWKQIVDFMTSCSPNRLKALQEQLPADSPSYNLIRATIYSRYKDLISTKDRGDSDLYQIKIDLVKADDDIFSLARQLRDNPGPERHAIRNQLRQRVGDTMRLSLKERELRIARLEKSLAEEKGKLTDDQKNVELRIDDRVRNLVRIATPRKAKPATTSQTINTDADTK